MSNNETFLKIYIADVACLEDEERFRQAYEAMPLYRRNKIDKLKPLSSKRLSLGAGLLLKYAFDENGYGDMVNHIKEGENKKPYIDNSSICFNLSHSVNKVMLALSSEEVGCDVQHMSRKSLLVALRCFSSAESDFVFEGYDREIIKNEDLTSLSEVDINILQDRFFTIWARKEAYVKLTGEGLTKDFREFNVLNLKEHFIDYKISDYRMAVCSAHLFEPEYREVSF